MTEDFNVPSFALVTPSFNQGKYLASCLESVLGQKYPRLQYVVMDGGSTDDSCRILDGYYGRLHACGKGPDAGQYDAINKGFGLTDGEIMGWLNSDDLHMPWTLALAGELFATFPEIRWLTTCFPMRWDTEGRPVNCTDVGGYSRRGMMRGENLPGFHGFTTWPIQQESTFWRRDLWEEAGGALDTSLSLAADFDLWMRFARLSDPVAVSVPLAGFRKHGNQKTSRHSSEYASQAMHAFRKNGGKVCRGTGRSFCRDRLPSSMRSIAQSLGLLHKSRIVRRSRDNKRWEMVAILV